MSFLINIIRSRFDNESVYNEKYLETKITSYVCKSRWWNTKKNNKIVKTIILKGIYIICAIILYIIFYITDDLGIFSDDSDKKSSDKKD